MSRHDPIPHGWQKSCIGDVADVKTGGTPSRNEPALWGGDIPWMASGEIHQRRVKRTIETITERGLQHSNATWLPVGAVMLALNGQGKTRGTAAMLDIPLTCNQSLAAVIPRNGQLSSEYLLNVLESQYDRLRSLTGDDERSGLNLGLIRELRILLPPISEQRKIGEILTAVDEAIERTRAVIDQTRRLKTALLQDLLTHGLPGRHSEFIEHKQIGKVPAAWRVMQLKDAVAYWQYGLSDSLADDGAYPCLRMNNYVDGRITAEDIKYANIDQKTFKHYKLERGDILFNRTNSRELVGKVGIFDLTGDCVFASYLVRMRTDRKVARAEFLNLILNTAENQHRIKRLATPGVSQSNINAENLKRMRVALPEVDEQDAILALLTSVRRSIETEAARLIQLTDTKAALSQALLTGRVRVNEIPEI